jgi:hypothetical protein
MPHALQHTNASVVKYTIYSAHISSIPPEHIVCGPEAATKKATAKLSVRGRLCYTALLLCAMDLQEQVMQDGNEEGSIRSVFMDFKCSVARRESEYDNLGHDYR